MEKMMEKLGEDIWVHEDKMNLMCTELQLRMTIVKLAEGGLWIHSPTALSAELKSQLEQLGPIEFIVSASNGHNLWLKEWQTAFPEAQLYVSAGIPKKLNLSDYHLLDETIENHWQQDLSHEYMAGVPLFNESVFLHKKTKALIVTDFIQHYPAELPIGFAGFLAKYIFRPIGFKDKCVAPPLKMNMIIKEKQHFSSAIKSIKTWDFDKIIVTHGEIIDVNAKQVFARLTERFLK